MTNECESCGRIDPCAKCGGLTSEIIPIYKDGAPTGRYATVTYPDNRNDPGNRSARRKRQPDR